MGGRDRERTMRLLILGATGGTGAQLTRQALERGHSVTAFVRSPQKMAAHEKLQIVQGDARDAGELARALREHDAVLSSLGAAPGSKRDQDIRETGARSTVEAMRRTNVRRLLVVSAAMLYPDASLAGSIVRFILRRHARDLAAMERVVEASDLEWTIVRPPRLTNGPLTGRYRISEQHAPPSGVISRADCAHAILDFAEKHEYVRRVIGVSS
jgi:putative NADH-flavin reductase